MTPPQTDPSAPAGRNPPAPQTDDAPAQENGTAAAAVAEWNTAVPIGARVRYGTRAREGRTASPAALSRTGVAFVWLLDLAAPQPLTALELLPLPEHEEICTHCQSVLAPHDRHGGWSLSRLAHDDTRLCDRGGHLFLGAAGPHEPDSAARAVLAEFARRHNPAAPVNDQASQNATAPDIMPPAETGRREYRLSPCQEGKGCPWTTRADLTAFTDDDMARLQRAEDGLSRPHDSSESDIRRMTNAPRMACHLDQPGTRHELRLCAGWLAVVGPHHIRVRLDLATGALPPQAVFPDTSAWPPLYASLEDLLAARTRQLTEPGHPQRC